MHIYVIFFTCLVATHAAAQASPSLTSRRQVTISRTVGEIVVDGRLDELTWETADQVSLPFETSPGNNTPAPVATECQFAYSSTSLYFGCEAHDPSTEGIRAYLTGRDNILGHDRIGVGLDLFNDARRAVEFSVSPLGVQRDARFDIESGWDGSWDAIWESAGQVTPSGYVVEGRIPFKSLNFPETDLPQTWGLFVIRDWPRDDFVEMHSMPIDQSNTCFLCQANILAGIQGVSPGRNIELTPTLTSVRTENRDLAPGSQFSTNGRGIDAEAGITGRWGITTNITANATVNPDFSQVEADEAQLDVNENFTLSFDERRPFFLESSEIYGTLRRLVFTRTISDPRFAASVSGKAGGQAFGLLGAVDRSTNLIIPGPEGSSVVSLDQSTSTGIARVRRDIGESNTVGFTYTGRVAADYSNQVVGFDGTVRPFGAWRFRGQAVGTLTDYPDSIAVRMSQPTDQFTGHSLNARVDYDNRHWDITFNASAKSPEFRADAGFEPQTNTRNFWAFVDGSTFSDGRSSLYTKLGFSALAQREERFDGTLLLERLAVWGEYDGPSQTEIDFRLRRDRRNFAGQTFTTHDINWDFDIRPSGSFQFNISGQAGQAIDFANVRRAFELRFEPWLRLRLGRHLEAEFQHTLQRLSNSGERIFTANISELRSQYSFTSRAYVRFISQMRWLNRNLDQYISQTVRARDKSLFSQILFAYQVNPQTALFLGYSDDWEGFREDLGSPERSLTQTRRTLFLKLGYAWRP